MIDGARVLVVDSDAAWRTTASRVLRAGGLLVTEASSAQECLDLIKENRPDLVLLNAALPDAACAQVCDRLKLDPERAGIPAILVSPPDTPPDREVDALVEVADGYIARPISDRELLAQVRLALRLERSERAFWEQTHKLRERVKELNCLYGISRLVDQPGVSPEDVLQGTVDLIPPAWQYPEVAHARIRFRSREFTTAGFQESVWRQASDLVVDGETIGLVEVYYLEERPAADEGPFLREERHLLDAIAQHLEWVASRMQEQDRALSQAQLLDSVRESVVATDAEGNVTYWGKGAEALYGYRADEVVGKSITFIVPPGDEEQEVERMRHVLERGSWRGEYLQQRKDGTKFWAETAISLVTDQEGQPRGLIGIDRDISARVRTAEDLRIERDRAQQYLDIAGVIIVALNARGEVTLVNRMGCQVLEAGESDILGLGWFDHFVPPSSREPVRRVFRQLMAGEITPVEYFENPVLTRHGHERDIAWHNALLTDEAGHIVGTLSSGRDITERKRAEEALYHALGTAQRRQREVSALLAASRAVLERRGFPDTARSIFDACRDLLGATGGYISLLTEDGAENEVVFLESGGLPCTVDPSLPMPIRGLRAEAFRTGEPVYENGFAQSEWTQHLPEGHVAMESVLFAPLVIERQVVGLLGLANKPGGFGEDDARMALAFGELAAIALRNSRVLEALENSEQRFRAVAETAQDAIISADASGRIVLWNRAAQALFGYSPDEAIGQTVAMLMPERLRERHLRGMQRLVSTGQPKIVGRTVEMVGLRRDGTEFPLELSLAMWRAGAELFFTAVLRDITQRKQAEEALRRHAEELEVRVAERTAELRASEAQLRALFEQAALGIAVGDAAGHVLECNRALLAALGRNAEEIRGKSLAEFSHPEDAPAVTELYHAIVEGGTRSSTTEMRYITANGQVRWAHATASLIQAEGTPQLTICILEDVTDQKEAQAALIASEKMAVIGQLAASVAHEVNNPLQSVIGCLCLAQEVMEDGGDTGHYLHIAVEELERAAQVMGQMRDLGRRSQPGERRPTDVAELVDRVLLLTQKQRRDAGVTLDWVAPDDLPTPHLQAGQIQQVFLNLVLNALEAMPSGGQLRVRVHRVDDPEGIAVTFTDTGVGIPSDRLESVFRPFESTKEHGIGLGLYVSRTVVEEHGGEITVESRPGIETMFRVWLPVAG